MQEEINKRKQALKEVFDQMDISKDNSIGIKELAEYLKGQGTSPEKIKEIMKEADSDGSGTMDFEEFFNLMTTCLQAKDEDTPEDFIEVFKIFDKDASGLIPINDIKRVMMEYETTMTDEEFDDLFQECEIVDGLIDYKKFINTMLVKS